MIVDEDIKVAVNSGLDVSPAFSAQNAPLFALEFPTVTSCQATLQASHLAVADVVSADFKNVIGRDGTAVTLDIGAGDCVVHFGDIAIAGKSLRLKYGVVQGNSVWDQSMYKTGFNS